MLQEFLRIIFYILFDLNKNSSEILQNDRFIPESWIWSSRRSTYLKKGDEDVHSYTFNHFILYIFLFFYLSLFFCTYIKYILYENL
jgi:hypothetical protein